MKLTIAIVAAIVGAGVREFTHGNAEWGLLFIGVAAALATVVALVRR